MSDNTINKGMNAPADTPSVDTTIPVSTTRPSSSDSNGLLLLLLDEIKAMKEYQVQQNALILQLSESQHDLKQQLAAIQTKMSNNADTIATQLLIKNISMPMKALWEALNGGIWAGIDVPMAIIAQCGIEKRADKSEGVIKGKSGLELNTSQGGGATPLILAAHAERLDVMEELIAQGADIGAAEYIYSLTALHVAAIVGQIEAIELLMRHNADVEGADASIAKSSHISPLSQAAFNGRDKAIDLLVTTYNAKINSEASDGSTPVYYASLNGHSKTIAQLLTLGAHTMGPRGPAALHEMAKKGKVEGIASLLACGALVDVVNSTTGNTALHFAAGQGHLSCVELLLAEGADPTLQNFKGQTPLVAFEQGLGITYNISNGVKKRIRYLLGPRNGEEEPSLADLFS